MLLLFSLDCIIPYSVAFLILVNFGFDSIPLYVSAAAPSIFRWFKFPPDTLGEKSQRNKSGKTIEEKKNHYLEHQFITSCATMF